MTSALEIKLLDIEVIVNTLCKKAYRFRNSKHKDWCVNWGDFKCVEVFHCESIDRNWYTVIIEEAAHDDRRIYLWFNDELEKLGLSDIEVRFEW